MEGGAPGVSVCQVCGGTCKVPILDAGLMRLPCPNQYGFWSEQFKAHCVGYFKGHAICVYCKGRNWVPNPDAWDMKKALTLASFQLIECSGFSGWGEAGYRASCQLRKDEFTGERETVWHPDPKWARLLAVTRALTNPQVNGTMLAV